MGLTQYVRLLLPARRFSGYTSVIFPFVASDVVIEYDVSSLTGLATIRAVKGASNAVAAVSYLSCGIYDIYLTVKQLNINRNVLRTDNLYLTDSSPYMDIPKESGVAIVRIEFSRLRMRAAFTTTGAWTLNPDQVITPSSPGEVFRLSLRDSGGSEIDFLSLVCNQVISTFCLYEEVTVSGANPVYTKAIDISNTFLYISKMGAMVSATEGTPASGDKVIVELLDAEGGLLDSTPIPIDGTLPAYGLMDKQPAFYIRVRLAATAKVNVYVYLVETVPFKRD